MRPADAKRTSASQNSCALLKIEPAAKGCHNGATTALMEPSIVAPNVHLSQATGSIPVARR